MNRDTKAEARGKWRSILAALGIPAGLLDGKHHPCPKCGGKDRFRFADYQGSGGFICNQCGNGSGFDLLMKLNRWDYRTAAQQVERILGSPLPITRSISHDSQYDSANLKLWERAESLTKQDAAGRYLLARCRVTNHSPALRFINSLYCSGELNALPTMLAMLMAPDGNSFNLHRTYLTSEGCKAAIEAPRRMMPGKIAKGSAVRLFEPATVLGIAEGIESALSATALTGISCWAALTADSLKAWQPPAMVTQVVIFADNDRNFVGQLSAFDLALRIKTKDRNVDVRIPEREGDDWNDVHRRSFVKDV